MGVGLLGQSTPRPAVRAADDVNFVKKNHACALGPGHGEELSDHTRTLADVFLNNIGADDADEAGVGPIDKGAGSECFASSGGPLDLNHHKSLLVKQRRFQHL